MGSNLGIALALHGKRAIRARVLNVTAVAVQAALNLAPVPPVAAADAHPEAIAPPCELTPRAGKSTVAA